MKSICSSYYLFLPLLIFLLLFPANRSSASVFIDLSTQELVKRSDSIVTGEVVDTYSTWNATGKYIVTYIKLKISEDIKGQEAGAQEVIIKKVGGRVGDREMIVHGSPRFDVGERTLLFLGKSRGGARSVMGMALGKFRITKDSSSGEEFAENPLQPDMQFVKKDASGVLTDSSKISGGRRIPLKTLVDRIKKEL